MIVSITERMKEIDIRKGTFHFLIGSSAMSTTRRCIGIALRVIALYLITVYGNLTPIIWMNSIAAICA